MTLCEDGGIPISYSHLKVSYLLAMSNVSQRQKDTRKKIELHNLSCKIIDNSRNKQW